MDNENLKYSAMVRITCDPVEHELEFDGSVNCEEWFSLRHPAGCAIHQSTSTNQDCTFVDPMYDRTFDLNELTKAAGYIVGEDGKYKFNVCDKVDDCDGGICIKQEKFIDLPNVRFNTS